jgi:pimeloyl-ACP methyl ester carboxylesterase
VAARVALSVGFYRPFTKAKKLHCPMLLLICQEDGVAPPEAARKAAGLGGDKVEVHEFPINHFDIYQPPHLDEALDLMTTFLKKHLLD